MDFYDDDKSIGRVLSPREVMKMPGGASALLIGGISWTRLVFAQDTTAIPEATEAAASCVVRPAETEDPYFVDEMLNRFDIRVDPSDNSVKDGIPLHLQFRVMQIDSDTCTPLPGAQVDIWHCDALGSYWDVSDPGFQTTGQKWLRGYQVTDDMGVADFMTIYPGWYSGRTVHIHFKIRTDPAYENGYEFTSQLFFDDTLSDTLFKQEPYASNPKGTVHDTPNSKDGIYDSQLLMTLSETKAADLAATYTTLAASAQTSTEATAEAAPQAISRDGYTAIFDITLDLSAAQTAVGGPMFATPTSG